MNVFRLASTARVIVPILVLLLLGFLWWNALPGTPRVLRRVKHEGATYVTINPSHARLQRGGDLAMQAPPLWVKVDKPEGVRRVVLLGDSAAAGFPMGDYHLGRLVQARWRARYPGERVEVINLSVPGLDSRARRGIVREAMALEPDTIVVYAEGSADAGDVRDVVSSSLDHGVKVLVCRAAARPPARKDWETAPVGEGPDVGVVDAGLWLDGAEGLPPGSAEFFLDDAHLTFAGRAAAAELIVDGMAALWGLAPGGATDASDWWSRFPRVEEELRRDVMFTPYDEHDMWRLAQKHLAGGGADSADLASKVEDLQRRAVLGCDTTDIIVAYDRAVLRNPDDPLVHFTAGRLLGLRGEGEHAEESFRRGFALDPRNAAARLDYAAMQLARGKTDEARATVGALREFDPRAPGLDRMEAAVAAREGDLSAAAALLDKHLRESPDDAAAWLTLAEIQFKLGDFPAYEASRGKAKAAAAR